MSKFYTEKHRALQAKFDTRRTADLLENVAVHGEAHEAEFIQSRDMFFLSTVDASGRPTVSYKGGAPGFVRVTGAASLLFPNYDGNGMYYSIGNIMSRKSVCCSSISKRRTAFAYRGRRKFCSTIHCWKIIQARSS